MRPYDGNYEDFEDFEDFTYNRSQAIHKLVNDYRRQERHRDRYRNLGKSRHREAWEWDDDDDYDSFVDDSCSGYSEGFNGQY